jgi:hypothetical protein
MGIFLGVVEITSVSRLLVNLICCSWKEVHILNPCSCKFANFLDFSRDGDQEGKGNKQQEKGKLK